MLNTESFALRLKKVMEFYSISASGFADTIEVPRSSISHILSGRNKPSLDFVLKITETYQEVDLYWLLKGIGNFPKSTPPTSTSKPKIIKKTENPILNFPKTEDQEPSPILETNNNKIEKVLFFYTDGTFKEYFLKN